MINKLVPISNVLSQLAEETDPEVLRMKPTLLRWAVQGDARIGTSGQFVTEYYVLDIINHAATIPLPAVHLNNMIMGDHLDKCPDMFNTSSILKESYSSAEKVMWKWTDNTSPVCYNVPWSIQNNQIVFHHSFNVDKLTVKVQQYETDVNGIPLINENHIEAIAAFLQAKLAMKHRWMRFKLGKLNNADRGMIADLKREFVLQARLTRGSDENTNDMDLADAAQVFKDGYSGNSNLNLVY